MMQMFNSFQRIDNHDVTLATFITKLMGSLQNEPEDDLAKLSNEVITDFFNLIFLYEYRKTELIDLIAKFFLKIKQIQVLSTVLAYYNMINFIREEIRHDYGSQVEFSVDSDIVITCQFQSTEESYLNSSQLFNDINQDICEFHLLFSSENKEKYDYLIKIFEKFFLSNTESAYYKYQIYYGSFPSPTRFKIYLKTEISGQKYRKSKDMLQVDSEFYIRECFASLEVSMFEDTDSEEVKAIKREAQFKKSFYDFKSHLEKNSNLFPHVIKAIYPFGSVTQFSQNLTSDLEITLLSQDNINISPENIFEEIIHLVKSSSKYTYGDLIKTKRTTLIEFKDRANKVKIQLTVDNYFGVLNSALIRNYFLIDQRAIILVNHIKNWSQKVQVNGNYNGYLSSYCYTLMVIYFLQRTIPPVLPIFGSNKRLMNLNVQHCHYFIEEALTQSLTDLYDNFLTENKSPVSLLLYQFFVYYLFIFDENNFCIDITRAESVLRYQEIIYLNKLSPKNNQVCCYCFIDPFDHTYNPGAYYERGSNNEEKLKNEMKIVIEKIFKDEDPLKIIN